MNRHNAITQLLNINQNNKYAFAFSSYDKHKTDEYLFHIHSQPCRITYSLYTAHGQVNKPI